ncbi:MULTISPECIES: hypothetical protein [Leeia]|uniref:Uncharacterized protein n=1 Tax=Leeia aquatica TaxID=2725557 RepID=A0A847SG33_9NEIS|nr:hypothetical protein [Leeia aquatica]NLR76189.1 hypothetical protein [Leeia aquatica]
MQQHSQHLQELSMEEIAHVNGGLQDPGKQWLFLTPSSIKLDAGGGLFGSYNWDNGSWSVGVRFSF